MSEPVILRAERLDVRYGSSRALFDVSIDVEAGSMVALLGANGAGKSTLARTVAGLIPVTSGTVTYDGLDITNWSAHRRHRAGLTYVPEGRGIFPGLSVIDNLKMAVRRADGRREREELISRAIERFPVLGERRSQRAASLSGGQQQMLALARALAVKPKLLIADEMSLGLAPLVVDSVFSGLEAARADGITILLIEQFIHRALDLADRCVILRRGEVGWAGPVAGARQEVLDRYLGSSNPASA